MIAQYLPFITFGLAAVVLSFGVATGRWANRLPWVRNLAELDRMVFAVSLMCVGSLISGKGFGWLNTALSNWAVVMQNEIDSGRFEPSVAAWLRGIGLVVLALVNCVGLFSAAAGITVVLSRGMATPPLLRPEGPNHPTQAPANGA